MSLREAAQQALEAHDAHEPMAVVMEALRTALAEPEQEPVAYVSGSYAGHFTVVPTNPALVLSAGMALYARPPQRKPLSDEKVWDIYYEMIQDDRLSFARAIERAHGIGGEA